jgi:PKHD-type hydroxylase
MICISDTINSADLASINFLIDDKNNQDGSLTAGVVAKKVKHNIQQFSGDALQYAENLIQKYCNTSSLIQNYAFPKIYSPMRLIRYQKGMYYGKHVDNVLQNNMRTDISFTVFLSPPESYEGGYLRIHKHDSIQDVKLPAGAMILYPSDSLHEITPVTSGERLVLVGWIQSYIRNPDIRSILFDIANARDTLSYQENNQVTHEQIMSSFNRLFRMHCDI